MDRDMNMSPLLGAGLDNVLETYQKMPPFRVLLVSPPVSRKTRIMKTLEPMSRNVPVVSLLYLGAVLEKEGRLVKISESENFSELRKEIEDFQPYVVGITATTCQMPQVMRTAQLVREVNPDILLVGGGPHMMFRYEEALQWVDVVVLGAGEIPLLELTGNASLSETKGIAFRENGRVRVNPPERLSEDVYNAFPPPAYHLVKDAKKYRKNVLIISSRGCPFSCFMCASRNIWGKWMGQRAEVMISHLEEILREFDGVDVTIRYYDDMFVLDRERMRKFLDLLKEKNIRIQFKCESRVDLFDEEVARLLKETGCTEVLFGIESGSERFLKLIDKKITLEQAERAVRIAHAHGLKVCGTAMVGYPGETEKDFWKTIRFVKKLELDRMQVSVLTPFPGTMLYQEAEKNGWIKIRDWEKYDGTSPVMRLEGDLDQKILWLMKQGYLSYYLDPRYMLRQLKQGHLIRGGYGKVILRTLMKYVTS